MLNKMIKNKIMWMMMILLVGFIVNAANPPGDVPPSNLSPQFPQNFTTVVAPFTQNGTQAPPPGPPKDFEVEINSSVIFDYPYSSKMTGSYGQTHICMPFLMIFILKCN